MNFFGIIPARGGSVGIPNKNLALLAGKRLIDYTFEAAKSSKLLDSIYVSTDNNEIAAHSRALDVTVPFIRDESLSSSDVPMLPVMQDFISRVDAFDVKNDVLVLLQPTSPMRTGEHIDEAISMMHELNADSIVSIQKAPHNYSPQSLYKSTGARFEKLDVQRGAPLIRQQKPVFYARNGPAIIVTKGEVIMGGELYGENSYGYLMNRRSSLDIDEPDDLLVAEAFLKSDGK